MRALIAALTLTCFMGGCALPAADIARKSLNTAESLRQLAEQQLDTIDQAKQSDIIAQAESSGDIDKARANMKAWYAQRFTMDVALSTLKSAILVGESVLSAVDAKTQGESVLAPAMAAVAQAVSGVMILFSQLGVKL